MSGQIQATSVNHRLTINSPGSDGKLESTGVSHSFSPTTDGPDTISAVTQSTELTVSTPSGPDTITVSTQGTQGGTTPAPGGASFAETPENIDDTNDEIHFYFGWEAFTNGGWMVRRMIRQNSQKLDADASNNPAYATLSDAWLARATLSYV